MEITEVRIKLLPRNNSSGDKLRAFCTITIDNEFVIRDLKIIEGARGTFVAMPSRRLTDRCTGCSSKNHLRSKFCGGCGTSLKRRRLARSDEAPRLYVDIAHPINVSCRSRIHDRIIEAFTKEEVRSQKTGYVFASDSDIDDDFFAGPGVASVSRETGASSAGV